MIRRELRRPLEGELSGGCHHAVGMNHQSVAEPDPEIGIVRPFPETASDDVDSGLGVAALLSALVPG